MTSIDLIRLIQISLVHIVKHFYAKIKCDFFFKKVNFFFVFVFTDLVIDWFKSMKRMNSLQDWCLLDQQIKLL
jgi:hypothetical protein